VEGWEGAAAKTLAATLINGCAANATGFGRELQPASAREFARVRARASHRFEDDEEVLA